MQAKADIASEGNAVKHSSLPSPALFLDHVMFQQFLSMADTQGQIYKCEPCKVAGLAHATSQDPWAWTPGWRFV